MRSSLAIAVLVLSGLLSAQEFKLGTKVGDFQVQDLDGKTVEFSSLRSPITVIVFISTQCPVSNGYNQRMIALYNDFSPRDVKFVFLNANQNESANEVRTHSKRAAFVFPVYKDINNVVADRFGAQVTPESFVVDRTGTIVYHGAIDDSQNEARIRTRGLRMALDAVFAGKPVEPAETKAFGCSIKRVRKTT